MNSIYETPAMKAARLEWAIKEWRKLPVATKSALLPVLKAAPDKGECGIQFTAAFNLPVFRTVAQWEWSALRDILVTIVDYATAEQLKELVK